MPVVILDAILESAGIAEDAYIADAFQRRPPNRPWQLSG
jgi:hypothetical protein